MEIKNRIIFLLACCLTACDGLGGGSSTTLVRETPNPAGDKKAIVFTKFGGATVANSYQVSITDRKHTLEGDDVGNVFTIDDDHGVAHLDSASIDLAWRGNDTLLIAYDGKARTFIQDALVAGVAVIYRTK